MRERKIVTMPCEAPAGSQLFDQLGRVERRKHGSRGLPPKTLLLSLSSRAGRFSTISSALHRSGTLSGRSGQHRSIRPSSGLNHFPTEGWWGQDKIPGTPRIRVPVEAGPDPLAYVQAGPVSFTSIEGASHHRTRGSTAPSGRTRRIFGVSGRLASISSNCVEVGSLPGLRRINSPNLATIPPIHMD